MPPPVHNFFEMVAGDVPSLRERLLDTRIGLPERFRVLFSLRAVSTPEAVDALLAGLDDSSALFRHEVAFALGQMQVCLSGGAILKTLS